MDDVLEIGGKKFKSRLLLGSGKFRTADEMRDAYAASGTEIVTVAIRRLDLDNPSKKTLLDEIDWDKYTILPNTAGCYTVDEALRCARLGRELTGSLLLHLDAASSDAASAHLDDATHSATEYGTAAAAAGLTIAQTIEAFLMYWAPFHHELALTARRRGFDGRETADLLEQAARSMDRLLLAVTAAHDHPDQTEKP